jgi:hypothetical protein
MSCPETIQRSAPEVWWPLQPLYEREYAEPPTADARLLEAHPENGYLATTSPCLAEKPSRAGPPTQFEHLRHP